MQLQIGSQCRAAEFVKVGYAGVDHVRRFDTAGNAELTLDLFAGDKRSAEITFDDGTLRVIPVLALDLGRVSKVAVRWRAPVNLDLHVFEYAAAVGQPGHVWAKSRSSLAAARDLVRNGERGHGYLSTSADGTFDGDRLEVYTFLHHEQQATGAIALAVDYESRGHAPTGATCGQGEHAKIEFQFFTLSRRGEVAQSVGNLRPVECGITIDAAARFNQSMLPMLRIRR